MEKKTLPCKVVSASKPKRLSKAGKWLKAHPNGLGGRILDMKAVMR
ncbi:MAG: hypothetical protein FWC26_02315 [Fibromonadales bacterium]|nr:hypothetical protein [Fibromonadales bacterium]